MKLVRLEIDEGCELSLCGFVIDEACEA